MNDAAPRYEIPTLFWLFPSFFYEKINIFAIIPQTKKMPTFKKAPTLLQIKKEQRVPHYLDHYSDIILGDSAIAIVDRTEKTFVILKRK